jgi:DNA polymerase-3 subunit alpha
VNPIKKFSGTKHLFDEAPKTYDLPALHNSNIDDMFDEIELFGYTLNTPFSLLKEPIKSTLLSKDLMHFENKLVEIVGYLVTTKPTRTSGGQRMYFGTFIDQEGMWLDTVHFPPSASAFPFRGKGCYKIVGKVTTEFDFRTIEVSELHRLAFVDREV